MLVLVGLGTWSFWHSAWAAAARANLNSHSAAGKTDAAAALRDTIARLQGENARLEQSLAAINAENTRLEKEKGQASHAIQLYRELTAQSRAQSQDPTNSYSTPRHVVVGLGKQARLLAEAQEKWGDIDSPDPEKQPDDEKQAMVQAMMVLVSEQFRLQRAIEDLKEHGWQAAFDEATSEGLADFVSCYLYGALNLQADQFYRANDLLQQYYKQAEQKDLLSSAPDETEFPGPKFDLPLRRETYTPDPVPSATVSEHASALKQLNESARGQIGELLSGEQKELFDGSQQFRDFRLVGGTFRPPGISAGAVAHFGARSGE
ncbi:MAG: hypothetical protein C5B50_09300 [Verrucomicrobia bacterium]|nr:MAG: hypothetical protein C5B50_09300 [Verrucomicrobiota bacterium]